MSEARKFWGAGAVLMGASLVVNVASYVFQALLARWLTDDDFGALKWASDWMGCVVTPVGALQVAMTRYAAVFHAQENPAAVASLAWRATRRLSWYGAAFVVFIVLAHPWLMRGFRLASPALLWVVAGIVIMQLAAPVTTAMLQGLQRFNWMAVVSMVQGCGRVVFGLSLAYLGYGAVGALGGQLIAAMVGTTVALWALRSLLHHRQADHSALDTAPVYRYFWPALVVSFSVGTIGLVDTSFVRYYFAQDVSGQYGKAKMIAQAFGYLIMPLAAVLFPKAAGDAARGGAGATRALWQSLGVTALIGVVAALACTAVPWLPVRILAGQGNATAEAIVAPFVWATLPLALVALPLQFFLARGEFRRLLAPLAVLVAAYPAGLWLVLHAWHAAGAVDAVQGCLRVLVVAGAAGATALIVLIWSLFHVGR
jgi:O-antigen/teichoic acid export membrane protein